MVLARAAYIRVESFQTAQFDIAGTRYIGISVYRRLYCPIKIRLPPKSKISPTRRQLIKIPQCVICALYIHHAARLYYLKDKNTEGYTIAFIRNSFRRFILIIFINSFDFILILLWSFFSANPTISFIALISPLDP